MFSKAVFGRASVELRGRAQREEVWTGRTGLWLLERIPCVFITCVAARGRNAEAGSFVCLLWQLGGNVFL